MESICLADGLFGGERRAVPRPERGLGAVTSVRRDTPLHRCVSRLGQNGEHVIRIEVACTGGQGGQFQGGVIRLAGLMTAVVPAFPPAERDYMSNQRKSPCIALLIMHNAQMFAGIQESRISLDPSFPCRVVLDGSRDDRPIESFHIHDVVEMGFCVSGHGTLFVGGKLLPFQAGDATFITPLEWHRCQAAEGTVSRWIWFFFDPSRLLIPLVAQELPYAPEHYAGASFLNVLGGGEQSELVRVFQELIHEARHGADQSHAMRALLYVFLARLHERIGRHHQPGRMPNANRQVAKLVPALDAMTSRYVESWRIADLASLCHMSTRNFQLRFKATIGCSPQRYLVRCRVQAAMALLRATDRAITQIALGCGFRSLSSFNRAFQTHAGQAPREFRRNV